MKLKLLLSTGLLLVGTHLAKAQATYGTWVGASQATSFDYNVAAGTLGANYASEALAKTSLSTTSSVGFLVAPSSGTAKVHTAASAGPGFTIDGSKLTFSASNLAGNANKFAIYGLENTSAVTSIFFRLNFNNADTQPVANASERTQITIAFGKSSADNIFENNSQMWDQVLTGIFGGFRFQIGGLPNGGVRHYRTNVGSPYGYTGADAPSNSNTIFNKTSDLDVEIYCNNTATDKQYSRLGGAPITLPGRTYNVYVNGVLLIVQITAPNQISNIPASAEIAADTKIDAMFISGYNLKSGSVGNISISNIKFGWIPESVLPADLTSFTGKKTSNGAELNWATASEKDNDYFEVLRASQDGVFKAIDKVNGKGTTNGNSNYQFVDQNPLNGNNYYKLKQVDLNGNSKEYGPVIVSFDLTTSKLAASVNADHHLLLTYQATENTNADITIVDLNGKKLISQKMNFTKGLNQAKLDVSALPKGLYLIKLGAKGNNSAAKFIK
ncbi:MAG: T9SS type A sorting domain-containing protein [Pedobacter sp.]|uniref:T9SS type A sorting domain-containing protein n=1 Tax=Pedobacter sp. TaxID=1411316 RepID=UPI00280937A3|nr:T9SS type A sorting domain-containing protein [Pedobacter sp.]MDQ8003565.1 T9SS type A sorting domain-containing protein [Pedobacter sp.]